MSLQIEIDQRSKEIYTDSYPISLGEVMSMYKEKELDIHPEFQRFFRWNLEQKSRLIESILLGIPIPPIFVSQREDGVWDVIDGLQRLSTIFEFVGILRNDDDEILNHLELSETNFLPSLKGRYWEHENEELRFDTTQRLLFKRSKLDFKIVKRGSDSKAKYELFQRLNTGGSQLSDQEVRNCIMIMINKEYYEFIKELNSYDNFQLCVPLTDRLIEEQFDMELVARYLLARTVSIPTIDPNKDIGEFITSSTTEMCESNKIDFDKERKIFQDTFRFLAETLEEDSFKKYSFDKQKYQGPFLISSFELIVPGLSQNLDKIKSKSQLEEIIHSLYQHETYVRFTKRGTRALPRFKGLVELSYEVFKQ